ncbi:MAG: ribulokinase [Candidatus Hinthialibacter antarcticus]|nr:ribulokinase [Candidatus Hinthialibacter antarcticus]
MSTRYALGIDFGTESGRALLVNVDTGEEVATHVYPYANGVIDEALPKGGPALGPDWALQDPNDWIETLKRTVPQVMKDAGAAPEQIVGIGVDFTSCTVLPVDGDGQPLCNNPSHHNRPHAWPKLWKHHAAQPEADKITAAIQQSGDAILERYGGKMSSEWIFPKIWQVLDEDEEIYDAAARFIEGGDWVVEQLCGAEARSSCMAGYKGMWDSDEGFPKQELLASLHPKLGEIVGTKLSTDIKPLGQKAGGLTEQAAQWMGLRPGIAVGVAVIDAHAAVPGASVTLPGRMVMVMGTSTCHMLLSDEKKMIPGLCGCVKDGILPGYYGYEAGQAAVGDIFAWYVEHCAPKSIHDDAQEQSVSVHELLEQRAASLAPGQNGLIALDWWNGNRSVLVDAELSGTIVGLTLGTKPEEIYRALIEATAFGTRRIIESFNDAGVPINEIYACGGLPQRNTMLMQIYADITGLPFYVAGSAQSSGLGAAILGAVAAGKAGGGYDDPTDAAKNMARLLDVVYKPSADAHKTYTAMYNEYLKLHDYFGRGENNIMKKLREMKLSK